VTWDSQISDESSGGAIIDTYWLEYSADAGSSWNTVQGALGSLSTATSGTQAGLTGGNNYVFRVSAHNIHGFGATSPEATFITATTPGAPGTPTVVL